jgi:hypothetical protein
MMEMLADPKRSRRWLAVYSVCLIFVASFILFEVLDVDGSDFPRPLSRVLTIVKLAEPPQELKRGHGLPSLDGYPSTDVFSQFRPLLVASRFVTLRARSASEHLRLCAPLARSSLADPSAVV